MENTRLMIFRGDLGPQRRNWEGFSWKMQPQTSLRGDPDPRKSRKIMKKCQKNIFSQIAYKCWKCTYKQRKRVGKTWLMMFRGYLGPHRRNLAGFSWKMRPQTSLRGDPKPRKCRNISKEIEICRILQHCISMLETHIYAQKTRRVHVSELWWLTQRFIKRMNFGRHPP